MAVTDHYKVLGVDRNATSDQIKKAYHSLAKQYHPDKNKSSGAEEKFKVAAAAYAVLSDSEKRRTYDLQKSEKSSRPKQYRQEEPYASSSTSWRRPMHSEPDEATDTEGGSSTGWRRFRRPEQSHQSGTAPFRHYFTSSFFTDFADLGDLFESPRQPGTEKMAAGARSKGKFGKSPPSFSFSFIERPEWSNNFFEDAFTDLEQEFDKFFGAGFHGMFDGAARFQKPFTEKDDIGSDEEWFDLVHGKRVGRKKAGDQSAFDEMWDWSVPMFKNKPHRRTPATPRKSLCLLLSVELKYSLLLLILGSYRHWTHIHDRLSCFPIS